ncbi:hypothetical protein BJ742DRAFT_795113 [Cladochytrium replicatum]|nr:hypothetical protein BJ742DRAFT_795113 [Cladochytrium replicatum]
MDQSVPVDDQELEDFRDNWQSEVVMAIGASKKNAEQSSGSGGPPSGSAGSEVTKKKGEPPQQQQTAESRAIEAYIKAGHYERMGALSDALAQYRDAFRLDPEVERHYRHAMQTDRVGLEARYGEYLHAQNDFYTYYQFGDAGHSTRMAEGMKALDDLAREFCRDGKAPGFRPMLDYKPCTLGKLPSEVVMKILGSCFIRDRAAIVSLSLVNKKMFVLTRERTVWRRMCEALHPVHVGVPSLDLELRRYNNDWFEMFLDKPRLRSEGVYISRVNYTRTGMATETSFYAPVHLVTYYRYLRFVPYSMQCYFWTTTIEPASAVKQLHADSIQYHRLVRGFMNGTYVHKGETIHIEFTSEEQPKMQFQCTMNIMQTRRGLHNKLVWKEYTCNRKDEPRNRMEIPKATLKPFIFSKVRSYLP